MAASTINLPLPKQQKTRRVRLIKYTKLNRSLKGDIGVYIMLIFFGAFMALPLIFVISTAFKPFDELFIFPPRFFVRNPTLSNFTELFNIMTGTLVPFTRYVFNTVFITAMGTIFHIMFASLAAYALSKIAIPGREFIFRLVVLSLMFSGAVTAIPGFMIMSRLGWVDTYFALIVPAVQASLGLYLMKQFMEQLIPDSLLEAARIDGYNEFGIFTKIVMPLVKPAWLTLAILTIQSLWNATGGVFIYSEQLKTLPVAMSQIVATGVGRAGAGAAIALLMMVVPITVFIAAQSRILETMATSGMKD